MFRKLAAYARTLASRRRHVSAGGTAQDGVPGYADRYGDDRTALLLEQAANGEPAERDGAIDELRGIVRLHQTADAWNALALGYFNAHRFDEAIGILVQLVEAFPDEGSYQLTLATAYSQVQNIELCRMHLAHLRDHGPSADLRRTAADQLASYEAFLGLTQDDLRLHELQERALSEAMARSEPDVEDFLRLARLLIRRSLIESAPDAFGEATEVLERGAAMFPDEPRLLEMLIGGYVKSDPHGRLDHAQRRLERIAPDSPVFDILSSAQKSDGAGWERDMSERVQSLLQQVCGPEKEQREAGLAGLLRLVTTYPDNRQYRLAHAMALGMLGRKDDALREARDLAADAPESHALHFNLAQVFQHAGDPESAAKEYKLALQFADNDADREQTREFMAGLQRQ